MSATLESIKAYGAVCPNCACVDRIVDEKVTRPLETSDVVSAWLFGLLGAVVSLFGRTTRRLRCLACGCRFPAPTGLITRVVLWLVLTTLAMLVFGGASYFAESSLTSQSLAWVSDACTRLAEHPAIALTLAATMMLAGIGAVIAGHASAAGERKRVYRALVRSGRQPD